MGTKKLIHVSEFCFQDASQQLYGVSLHETRITLRPDAHYRDSYVPVRCWSNILSWDRSVHTGDDVQGAV